MTTRPLTRAFRISAIFRISILCAMGMTLLGKAEARTHQDKQAPSCTAQGYLRIAVYPVGKDVRAPVALVIADPEGRRIGYDSVRKAEYSDVPEGTNVGGQEPAESAIGGTQAKPISGEQYVEICNPIGGQYELRLIGIKPGKYTMSVSAASREFLDSSDKPMSLDSRAEIPATITRRGTVQSFLLVYSRTPGVKVRIRPATK
jgi:hypothetical protein